MNEPTGIIEVMDYLQKRYFGPAGASLPLGVAETKGEAGPALCAKVNLPVPALVESENRDGVCRVGSEPGEARESAKPSVSLKRDDADGAGQDSRGGQSNLSGGACEIPHELPKKGAQSVADCRSDARPAQKLPRYKYTDEKGEHLHTLDGRPLIGTSTACGVLAKPLTWWAAGMALAPLGWLNPRKAKVDERRKSANGALVNIKNMVADDYEKLLQICYRAHHDHKNKAAVGGTDMHAELETYVKNCIYVGRGDPMLPSPDCCEAETVFAEWALNNVAEFLWSEAHCYSERLWTGGICDCGAILKGGGLAIIDFKSSKEAYYSQFVQCGGYAAQIQENGLFRADGTTISSGMRLAQAKALIVFPFGGKCEPRIETNVEGYKRAFEAAVTLHKLQTQYES